MDIIGKKIILKSIFEVLRETPFTALRQMLTHKMILHACAEAGHTFRERKYGPVFTVLDFLTKNFAFLCVLSVPPL